MTVCFGQIYIRPGVWFPFSYIFQQYISSEVSALVAPSATFIDKYGRDFDLIFRMSAKRELQDNEIKGPTVFRKDKDVEYSIFLPFDVITSKSDIPRAALEYLLKGVCSVFDRLGIDSTRLVAKQQGIIDEICSDPAMFEHVLPT